MSAGSIPYRTATLATTLAAIAAAAGLLVPGLYRDAPNWVEQGRGTDLATLFVAVPVLVLGLWTARGGSAMGRLAVVAGLLYVVYNYAIFVFSVVMNPLTAVYIAIFGLALWSLVLGGQGVPIADAAGRVSGGLLRRTSGGLLIAVGLLFGLLWVGQIATTATTGVLPPDLVKAAIGANPVYALDLGFFLPLCVLAGIGLVRGTPAGAYALPMLMWVPLMGAGVLGGFVFIAAAGDEVPLAVAVVIAALGLVAAVLAAMPLVRHPAGTLRVSPA